MRSCILWVCLIISFLFNSFYAKGSLSGTYTIDATKSASSSNYKTFSAAVSDLLSGTRADGGTANGSGVSGAVVFNVANGSYNEQISFNAISGASSTNNITFQSASGDSSKVILNYASASSSTNNYVVQLSGASWINFKQITIWRTGSNIWGNVITVQSSSSNNSFVACRLFGSKTSSMNTITSVVYSSTDNDTNNLFQGNAMKYGSYAFYWNGVSTSSYERSTQILGNLIDSCYYSAIYMNYEDNLHITGNTITNVYYSYATGVYLNYSVNAYRITKNKLVMPNGGNYGFSINNSSGTSTARALIANNMISMAGSNQIIGGLYFNWSSYTDIYYNSINLTNTNTSSYGMYLYSFNAYLTNNLVNNCVTNFGGGFAMYVYYYDVNMMDYNNWYASGTTLGTWNGNNYNNLVSWQSASGKDAYAISVNPYYNSSTDLHCSSPQINGAAYSLAAVTDDIDGDKRSTTPDIGADEFNLPPLDAGVTGLTNPNGGYCAGTNNIKINLTNFGSNTLSSAKINWSVNGTLQTAYSWTGTLSSGGIANVTIGTYSFAASTSYNIKVWSSNPNAGIDGNAANDTTNIVNMKQGLSGTYTIGGTTPDYASFGAAAFVLNNSGICGAVTFNVRDGSYNEQLMFLQIPNASATNTVTFQSQSGDSSKVILYYASGGSMNNNFTVQLNGTDYLNFKQITIQRNGNISNFYGRVLDFRGGACSNTIKGCRILGLKSPYYYYNQDLIYSGQDNDSANQFIGNYLVNGTYGFNWNGSSSSSKEKNTVVMNNVIDSTLGYGNQFYYQDGLFIKNNKIRNLSTGSTSWAAYGLNLNYCDNIKGILKNNIYILGASYNSYGIQISNCTNTSTSPALFANNMISVDGAAQYGTYGIYENGSSYHNFYFNSVLIPNAASTSYAFYLNDFSGSQNIVNNCFINKGGGQALWIYGYYVNTMNYNDIYAGTAQIGYWSGTTYSTFANWKTGTSKDANSISVDPYFASNTNLHVSNVSLDKKATPISGITDDIDGDLRNATKPDIGADEFKPFKTDAGIVSVDSPFGGYCVGAHNVKASIMNYGSDTLKSVTVSWSVKGTAQTPYSWTGTLLPGGQQSLNLGLFTFSTGSTYTIKVWTTKPNGGLDSNALNDTNQRFNLQQGLNGTYTIGGTSPDYVNFSLASTDLMNRGVCGAVLFNVRDGSYNEQVYIKTIPNASSTYTVTFQSQSLDSSKVNLNFNSGTWPNNYTLQLIGASYITFNKLTISRTGTNFYGTVVEFKGGSSNNRFLNCQIFGVRSTNNTNYNSLFYSASDLDSGNWFKNNYLRNGSYGFYYYGISSSSLEIGTVIDHNLIDSCYNAGITLAYQDNVKITNNIVRNLTFTNPGGSSTYGLQMNYCNNALTITGNKIYLPYDGYGMYIYYCVGTASAQGYINNNFVTVGGNTSASYCIYSQYSNYHNYSFNNLLMTNNYQLSCAVNHYGYSIMYICNFSNNNIVNTGGGFAMYVGNSSGIGTMYNNNYYVTGRYLGYWSGSNAGTLAAWKSISGHDTAAINVNPYYYNSTTDLHVFNPLLNAAAKYNPGIKLDIDKQTRNTSTPDIGADEFTPANNDAGISALVNPYGNFCPANTSVVATLVNFGTNTLTSATINWIVNGVSQTSYSWTGSLSPGSSTNITIGTYAWSSATVYNVKVYPTSPNGAIDGNNLNDTTYYQNLYCGLNGTYTIGGTSPDYSTFTAAANDLNLKGLCGNVTFNVRDGSYNEQIALNQYPNANIYSTLFQSQSLDSTKVNLFYPSNNTFNYLNYTVMLNGADNITFQKMTISRTGTNIYGRVIQIQRGANRNRFYSNIIQGVRVQNTNPIELMYSSSDRDTGYIISNNAFRNGSYAIYLYGLNNNITEHGLIIQNNIFDSNYYAGINVYYQDSVFINGNKINNILSSTGYGINAYYVNSVLDISKNKIYMPNGGYGIYIYFWNQNNTAPYGRINNNFIAVGGNSGVGYGLYTYWSYNLNVYFNNINVYNTASQAAAVYYNYSWNLKSHNNNFVNSGGGMALNMPNFSTFSTSNNNNYFTSGKILASLNGSFAFSLSDWKTSSSKDTNAVSTYPFYKSKYDLHINNKLLDSAAVPMGGITTDIDGDIRNTTKPDIGADEIKIVNVTDIAVTKVVVQQSGACEESPVKIGVVILNNGTKTQSGIPVYASLSGGYSGLLSGTYSKALTPGAYDTFYFSTKIVSTTTSVGIIGYSALTGDMDHTNDSFPFKFTITYRTPLPSPNVNNASRCASGSLKLSSGPARSGLHESWYAADTGGIALAYGDTFNTPIISKTTKYYVQSNGKGADTLGTTFVNGNNSSQGVMFDIIASNPISIDSFDIAMTGSSDTVEVYYKSGSYQGYEFSPSSWKLLGKKYISAPKGAGNPTHIKVAPTFPLTSGKTYGFYIRQQSYSNIRSTYFNGGNYYSNNDLSINTGKLLFMYFNSVTGVYYAFNGRVYYTDSGCSSKRSPVTATITHGMKGSKWIKGSTYNGAYDSGTVTNPDIVCYGNTLQYEVTPPTGYNNTGYAKKWSFSSIVMSTVSGNISKDTSFSLPNTFNNGILTFTPGATTLADSVYLLSITVSDSSKSCDSVLYRYIYVAPKAKAAFNVGASCLNSTTLFSDSTNTKAFGALTYTWNFGDTTGSSLANPTHIYTHSGSKTVWMKVSSGTGCGVDSVSKTITIANPPKAWFGSTSVCSGDSVYFSDSSTIKAPSTAKSYKWYFGDGATSTLKNPAHLYASVTSYTVSEVVTTSSGCTDSVSRTIKPNVKAPVSLQVSNFCLKDSTKFIDTAATTQISLYAWTFGDGNTGTGQNPYHIYATSGTYKVKLKATSKGGCISTDSTSITINPLPAANTGGNQTMCANASVFLGTTAVSGDTYSWTSKPAGFTSSSSNPNVSPSASTKYILIETNTSTGCFKKDSAMITVNPSPSPNAGNDTNICPGTTLSIGSAAILGHTYSWVSKPLGFTSTSANPSITPTVSATYYLTEKITSTSCSASDSIVVSVKSVIKGLVAKDTSICKGKTISLGVSKKSGIAYTWSSKPLGYSSNIANPSVTPVNSIRYYLSYYDSSSGCSAKDSIMVKVNSLPVPVPGTASNVCAGSAASIGGPSSLGHSYSWSSNPLGYSSTSSSNTVYPKVKTIYYITDSITSTGCSAKDSVIISVKALPTATAGNDTGLCKGSAITIGAAKISKLSYSWTSSPIGYASNISNPTVSPSVTTTYYLAVKDSITTCTNYDTVIVTVNPLPSAVVGSPKSICSGQSYTIGAASVSGDNYSWISKPAGFTSSASSVAVSPTTTTKYILTETVSATGCSQKDSVIVTVNPLPLANAGPDDSVCLGNSAKIGSTSVIGNSYSWTSNPTGYSSTTSSGSVKPTITTSYYLSVKNTGTGCMNYDTVNIKVKALPTVSAGSALSTCITTASVKLTGASPSKGYWKGTGVTDSINGIFTPSKSGKGSFSLTYFYTDSTSGCSNMASTSMYVSGLPTALFKSDSTACQGVSFTFTNKSSGDSLANWWFGDGNSSKGLATTTVSNSYVSSGKYTIKLKVTNAYGCSDSFSSLVRVDTKSVPSFSMNKDSICSGNKVVFTNKSTGTIDKYFWNFGNGDTSIIKNPSESFSATGDSTFYVKLSTYNGCGAVSSKDSVMVMGKPSAAFATNKTKLCAGDSLIVLDKSKGIISTWSWSFGNGSTSKLKNPLGMSYSSNTMDKFYPVKLTVGNTCFTDTASLSITVYASKVKSIVSANILVGYAPLKVNFHNTSPATGNLKISYDYGDGSSGPDTFHTFKTAGVFVVKQIATNGCALDTATISIDVRSIPIVKWSGTKSICSNLIANFKNITNDSCISANWDFGDGNIASGDSTAHHYSKSGKFIVKLSVVTKLGYKGSYSDTVTVMKLPNAKVYPDTIKGCSNKALTISKTSTSDTYLWSFGDGDSATGNFPKHTYLTQSTYVLNLIAIGSNGCVDSGSAIVVIGSGPASSFTMSQTASCKLPITVSFTNTSTNANTYAWSFGNGRRSYNLNDISTFDTPGVYTVRLICRNPNGCADTNIQTFTVNPIPKLDFLSNNKSVCQGEPIEFYNKSNFPSGAATYKWLFGNGDSSILQDSVSYLYPKFGRFDVSLISQTSAGCIDTFTKHAYVTVHYKPHAGFTYALALDPFYYGYTNFHTKDSMVKKCFWTFGDGTNSTDVNPSHKYGHNGSYIVSQIVQTQFGCADTTIDTVIVDFEANIDVTTALHRGSDIEQNKYFFARGIGVREYTIRVFNRWGGLVWSSEELKDHAPSGKWDGTFNGANCPPGLYIWDIEGHFCNGKEFQDHGVMVLY